MLSTKLLSAFRSLPGVAVVDLTDNIAQRYAALVMALKRQGTPIPMNDIQSTSAGTIGERVATI